MLFKNHLEEFLFLFMAFEILTVFHTVSLTVGTFQVCLVTLNVVQHVLVPSQEFRRILVQQVQ